MTVAFSPSRGARWGTEYCESHIEAHFGVYRWIESKKNKSKTFKCEGLVPPEHKNPGLLYEQYQVAHLRKWAPVRTYFGSLGKTGERGERWKLWLRLLTRHTGENVVASNPLPFPSKPQPFSLILTIADPEKKVLVYNEMSQLIQSRFEVQNLAVRAAARIRTKS
jgi:hypothetical protein